MHHKWHHLPQAYVPDEFLSSMAALCGLFPPVTDLGQDHYLLIKCSSEDATS